MENIWHTYRVWMKDGYARLVNATSEEAAKASAVTTTAAEIKGVAMDHKERRLAVTVEKVEKLS